MLGLPPAVVRAEAIERVLETTASDVQAWIHGVHGTATFGPDQYVLFAGQGGEVIDDPDHSRDELERLSYPRWEAEYRLRLLRELDEHQMVLVFWT